MATITFENRTYTLNNNESVLACLMRHGIDYPHACQAGICQSCLIKANCVIDAAWQEGIQDTLKKQGYFLACLAKPTENIQLLAPLASECEIDAKIISIIKLTHNVIQVKLQVEDFLPWIPGQYLNLINSDGLVRSYSIANIPSRDNYIELHIKLEEQGLMARWLKEKAAVNQAIRIRGPLGKCFYFNPKKLTYDILLAGTGTGLSPLIGIARDALFQNHHGNITLLHGVLTDQDIYYHDELKNLASQYPAFNYKIFILRSICGKRDESIDLAILQYIKDPKNLRVYICGPEEITRKLKMKAFCSGVPSQQIASDAFI
ncbi:MAG: 2Fe-2S iron-sulfur cluster binding domain-containing protein [Gammaproteobacteria bacterium]|nr:2Fe-2S iron-sulfur cluster binding domain-containing protein [Gammaproteobacteria bacterium]